MTETLRETQSHFSLQKRDIIVRERIGEKRIDVANEYRTSAGPLEFDVVIEFGDLYKDMAGSTIPVGKRWTTFQNGDARIMFHHSNEDIAGPVKKGSEQITDIVQTSSYQNPLAVGAYGKLVNELTEVLGREVKEEIKGATPIVALRAGLPMTEALAYNKKDMVLLEAKRLNGLNDPNKLALGIRFVGNKEEIMKKLEKANGKFVNADPALATGSTQLGILLWLFSNKIVVKNFTALSIGAAQQGLEILNATAQELRDQGHQFSFNTVSAGLHPTLTAGEHPYYIQTAKGKYAVGDGGDFLDLLLPPEFRKRWPERITQAHIDALKEKCIEGNWESIKEGDDVTLANMVEIQQILNANNKKDVLVGNIFKKEE